MGPGMDSMALLFHPSRIIRARPNSQGARIVPLPSRLIKPHVPTPYVHISTVVHA